MKLHSDLNQWPCHVWTAPSLRCKDKSPGEFVRCGHVRGVPEHEFAFEIADLAGKVVELRGQAFDNGKGDPRQSRHFPGLYLPDKGQNLVRSLGRDDTELRQMGADGVKHHGALAYEEGTRPVQHQDALTFLVASGAFFGISAVSYRAASLHWRAVISSFAQLLPSPV